MKASFLLLTLLTLSWSAHADLRLIEFEDGKFVNTRGTMDGSWRMGGSGVKMTVHKEDSGSYCLKFSYNVSGGGQNAGYWFGVTHLDLRPYEAVRFKVRGRNGGEGLAFGLKDDRWYEERVSVEKYLDEGITKEWQTVTVPLKAFAKVRQWDSMDNFSFSFLNSENLLPRSEVFVRDVELIESKDKNKLWHVTGEKRETFPVPFKPEEATDDQLLDLVERSAFGFFWNEANPANGLIKDRCYAYGPDQRRVASIASVGFGLSAICVAEKRGWVSRDDAYQRVLATLRFFERSAQKYNGFYFHYYEMDSGAPVHGSEISSIDTGILLMGVLTVKHHFSGTEVETIAQTLLEETNWQWMANKDRFISMAWHPGDRFEPWKWKDYNEGILLYFLAIGSPTYPLAPESWDGVEREAFKHGEREFVVAAGENCLFEHQYPQVWLDLRGWVDRKKIDYFVNSREATLANREWCLSNAGKFKSFAEGYWGLTACDGPTGYVVNGAPYGKCDGTVAPTAALSSIVFTRDDSLDQLRRLFRMQDKLWGKYGFVDGFNLDREWFSSVYIGIDLGPTLLMIENYRTGMIWEMVGRDPAIQAAYKKMGFVRREPPPQARGIPDS